MAIGSLPKSLHAFSFDMYSDMAHFRDIFTQSFFKTLPAPPRTTIIGILGAAMGLNESDTISLSNKLYVGSKILSMKGYAKEITTAINQKSGGGRTPVMRSLVVNPSYRLYVGSEEKELIQQLHNAIRSPVFPLYLGISECLANTTNIEKARNIALTESKVFRCTIESPTDISYTTKVDAKGKIIFFPELVRTVRTFTLSPKGRMPLSYVNLLMFYNCSVELKRSIGAYDFGEPICMI